MGVRLYNPIRGAFTSTDPVAGGNSTAYTYPQDPINDYDLSGEAKKKKESFKDKLKKLKKKLKKQFSKAKKVTKKQLKKIQKSRKWKVIRFGIKRVPWIYVASCVIGGSYAVYRSDTDDVFLLVGDFTSACLL